MKDYAALAAKFQGASASSEMPETGGMDYNALASQMGGASTAQPAPIKIGAEGFGEALRGELKNAGWAGRNLAGMGTAVTDLYQGAKQLFGQGDKQQIEAQKIIAEEAPIGALAGNVALTALPGVGQLARAGTGFKTAAGIGAGLGALAPVAGDQSAGNVISGKLQGAALGAAGGLAGQAVANKLSQYTAGKAAEMAALKETRKPIDQTIKDAIDAGLKIPPSSVTPSIRNLTAESIAGKDATKQIMSNENADVFDALARKATGLAPDAPLTTDAMQAVRKQAYQAGYEPVASVGTIPTDRAYLAQINAIANKYAGLVRSFPGAAPDDVAKLANIFKVANFDSGDALQASQFLRDRAKDAFRAGDTGIAKANKEVAKAIEDQLERHLSQNIGGAQTMHAVQTPNGPVYLSGQDMLKNFRDARQLMAKAHTVEDAIVEGGGSINAKKLGQRVQQKKPLSDELAVIGNFANNFSKASQPRSQIQGPGVSKLGYYASTGIGAMLGIPFGVGGAAIGAAGTMAAPYAVRAALGSKPWQQSLIRDYGPTATTRAVSAFRDRATIGAPLVLSDLARIRQEQQEQQGVPMRDLAGIR